MPRLPLIPTLIVALAAAAMVWLGIWQLERRSWKLALLDRYAANAHESEIAFPRIPLGHDELLFRRASAYCLEPTGWQRQAGRATDGSTGWLVMTRCRTGAEGPGFAAALGVAEDPKFVPQWKGGLIRGTITHAPSDRPLIANLFGKAPPRELMLVADRAPAGLKTSTRPDPSSVPNNHLAYAVQWFIFAALAVGIYLLALHYRRRELS